MKTLSLLLVIVSGFSCSRAYAQTLEPCELEFLGDYYRGVDQIIDGAVGQAPSLSLTTLPSFWAESGVRLVGSEVYFVQFKAFFWGEANSYDSSGRGHMDFSTPHVKTSTYRAAISPELAKRIKVIYARAISGAEKTDRRGLDGVSYRFSIPRVGCGETWSPEPDTSAARLVQLSDLLAKHAKLSKPRDMQLSEESIARLVGSIDGG